MCMLGEVLTPIESLHGYCHSVVPKGRRVCEWLDSAPTLGGMLDFYTVGYAEAVRKAYGPVLRGVIVRRSDRTAYEETDTCMKHPKI